MLDKSMCWDRMSKGIQWPKMQLLYKDGNVEETDGTTYQYEHGLRVNGRRPIKITLLCDDDDELMDYLKYVVQPLTGTVEVLNG